MRMYKFAVVFLSFMLLSFGCRIRSSSVMANELDPKSENRLMRAIMLSEKTQNSKLLNDQLRSNRLIPLTGPLNLSAESGPLSRKAAFGACGLVAYQIQSYLYLLDPEEELGYVLTAHDFEGFFRGILGENSEGHTFLLYPVQVGKDKAFFIIDPTFTQFPEAIHKMLVSTEGRNTLSDLLTYGMFKVTERSLKIYADALSLTLPRDSYPKIDELPSFEGSRMREVNQKRVKSSYYFVQENRFSTLRFLDAITESEIHNRIARGKDFYKKLLLPSK